MKTSVITSALVVVILTSFQSGTFAQPRRWVVISPRVGVTIDSFEATTYNVFQAVADLHAASVFQAPDSSLCAVVTQRSADGRLRDTTYAIPVGILRSYAERIDHWEEIAEGRYQGNASQPQLSYEDGTPIAPPPYASVQTLGAYRHMIGADRSGRVLPVSPSREWRLGLSSGEMLEGFAITDIADSFYLKTNAGVTAIAFDSIITLERHKPSHYWDGAIAGTLIGGIVGGCGSAGAASFSRYTHGEVAVAGILGMFAGMIAGFVRGGAMSGAVDECHDLSQKTRPEKIDFITTTIGWNHDR